MRRFTLALVLACVSTACAPRAYTVAPMTASIRAQAAALSDDHLRDAVIAYVSYLDTLRIVNSTEARSELRKLNWITLGTLALASGTATYALSSASEKSKAQVAGTTGVAAAFATALLSQFHHKEDSQAYRACSRQVELVLATFVVPSTVLALDSLRSAVQGKLDSLDCLAPLDH